MTEQDWLLAQEPDDLLRKRNEITERQLILFGCACCRWSWNLLPGICCAAVETAEQYADGLCSTRRLWAARTVVEETYPDLHWTYEPYSYLLPHGAAWFAAFDRVAAAEFEVQHPLGSDSFDDMLAALKDTVSSRLASAAERNQLALYYDERAVHAELLRDILGNPFRPVKCDPTWRTSDAIELARQMYEAREFSAMPILADALQDAGCDNDDVLDHCRDANRIHVRGCWVVDLVLGKT